MEPMVNVLMDDEEDLPTDFEESGMLADSESLLGESVTIESESCWFRTCVFGCSDVAASNQR
jgi:hypothetical protein